MLLLAVNDFPPLLGGEAALYHGLARRLPAGSALVLAPRLPGAPGVDAALAVEVLRRPLPPHRGLLTRAARAGCAAARVAAILARRPINYVACGQLLSIGGPVSLIAAAARVPYAVFVHGADLADFAERRPWSLVIRRVLEGAHAVIANSRFTAGLIERLMPGAARRVVVLPMGVEAPAPVPEEAIAALRARHALGSGPVLLSVARLVPVKGHDVILEALPALLRRFPDLNYVVVGGGPAGPALRARAERLQVGGRVVFAGAVPAADLPAYFRMATLFVQLSRDRGAGSGVEGFGLSFLEAASHGIPSVGGRSGGVPEAVLDGGSGVLVPPEDVGAFGAAVERLLGDDAERGRLARGARRWAEAHRWDTGARLLLDLAAESRAAAPLRRAARGAK